MTLHVVDREADEHARVAVDILWASDLLTEIETHGGGAHLVQIKKVAGFYYLECRHGGLIDWATDGDLNLSSAFDALVVEHLEAVLESLSSPAPPTRPTLAPEDLGGEGRPRTSGEAARLTTERSSGGAGDDLEATS